jgi:hypothetical protein
MEINIPAAIATAVICLLAIGIHAARIRMRAWLSDLQEDARQAGHLEGHARGVGETEARMRKDIARAYERGCADTLASLQDFEQAEREEQVARAA